MSISPPGTYPDSAADIRAQCDRLGIRQVELARRVGVAPVTVYRWTTGATRPDPRTLRAIKAMRKRIEVNSGDLETVTDWWVDYDLAYSDYAKARPEVARAFTRLRAATKKTHHEPMRPD